MRYNQLFTYTLHAHILTQKDNLDLYTIEIQFESRQMNSRKSRKGEKTGSWQLNKTDAKNRKLITAPIKSGFIYQKCYFYTLYIIQTKCPIV